MKIALCFLISYEHTLHKEQLWIDWIRENKDIINVYFHYKDINAITSPWIKLHTIPPSYTQPTSYYNVVPAYISVISYAFYHDTENVWFCLLTDSCVPIISPKTFRKLFFNHYQASIFKWRKAYWDIRLHRRANLRLLKEEYWLANDPWFTLSRDHVHKSILFLAIKQNTYQTVNNGGLANESIFAIILQTFNQLTIGSKTINESSTISDWSRMTSPTSPYTFKDDTPENINMICQLLKDNKYAIFLRKVDTTFPTSAIQNIMDTDFGHIYDVLHNQSSVRPIKNYTNIMLVALLSILCCCVIWFVN